MNPDTSLIGVVFSVILFIIFFSAIVLYLSFRLKETFKNEDKKKSATIVKTAFIIGVLFLAGAAFYYFANQLKGTTPNPPSGNDNITKPSLSFTASYPTSTRTNSKITVTFTIINSASATAHGVTIQAPSLLSSFTVQSTTSNIVGNAIEVGEVPQGTTIVSLELTTPTKPSTVTDTATLLYQESTTPLTQQISISIRGGP